MKKIVTVVCAALLLASCGNKMMLMKRHYTNGFYLSHAGAAKSTAVAATDRKEVASQKHAAKHTVTPTVNGTTTVVLPVEKEVVAARPLSAPSSRPAYTPAHKKHLLAEEHKLSVKANLPVSKRALHEGMSSSASDQTIIEVILCLLIPPLAVYLHENAITSHFWIDLLLCFLFFLPGVIYALIICLG